MKQQLFFACLFTVASLFVFTACEKEDMDEYDTAAGTAVTNTQGAVTGGNNALIATPANKESSDQELLTPN